MKSFNEYISNKDSIVMKWVKTRLLEGCDNKTLAFALQGQLDINETIDEDRFKRLSIPLVRRVFGHVSADRISGTVAPTWEQHTFDFDYEGKSGIFDSNLDLEAQYAAKLASDMANEIMELTESGPIAIRGLTLRDSKITLNYNRVNE